ncbi:MAG: hypothetical protein HRU75_06235 [Planctomycetia bacterium]|nr:MAG: hypothetical protein HRU75_06235 [Planctomycetia bacterium]
MMNVTQELMTPREAARWFRRSPGWLRQQRELLRVTGPGGQPLYHVAVCRAYVLARMCEAPPGVVRRVQVEALERVCGVSVVGEELDAVVASPPALECASPGESGRLVLAPVEPADCEEPGGGAIHGSSREAAGCCDAIGVGIR